MNAGERPKTFKETLESHPAIVLTVVSVAAFTAGFSARSTIQEVSEIQTITKPELQDLQKRAAAASTCPPNIVTASVAPSSRSNFDGPDIATVHLFEFSSKLPFPSGYENIVPGMRLSDAQRAFPGGELEGAGYRIQPTSGAFQFVTFTSFSREQDPVIEGLAFRFRNEATGKEAMTKAGKTLANVPHKDERLGTSVSWPVVDGFRVSLDKQYLLIQSPTPNREPR